MCSWVDLQGHILNFIEGEKSVAGGDWVGEHQVTDGGGRGVVPVARVDPVEPKLDGSIGGLLLTVLGVLLLHSSSLGWFGFVQFSVVTLLATFCTNYSVGLALFLPGSSAPVTVTVTLGRAAEHAWSTRRWW